MESIGQHLRRERELRHMSLEELAQTTRIPIRALEHLEADRFDQLPGEVFVRGFIKSYARAVGIDSDSLVARFGARNVLDRDAPAPITAITPPERGRRFGIAIALVILLILFTLALSIVLRPRHRDIPIELSRVDAPVERAALLRRGTAEPASCVPSSPMLSSSGPSTTVTPIASSPS